MSARSRYVVVRSLTLFRSSGALTSPTVTAHKKSCDVVNESYQTANEAVSMEQQGQGQRERPNKQSTAIPYYTAVDLSKKTKKPSSAKNEATPHVREREPQPNYTISDGYRALDHKVRRNTIDASSLATANKSKEGGPYDCLKPSAMEESKEVMYDAVLESGSVVL